MHTIRNNRKWASTALGKKKGFTGLLEKQEGMSCSGLGRVEEKGEGKKYRAAPALHNQGRKYAAESERGQTERL